MARHSAPETVNAKPKKAKRRYKGLIITLVSLLSVIGIACIGVGILLNTMFDYDYDSEFNSHTDDDLGISSPIQQTLTKKVTNIALFGVDSRNPSGYTGNTDSIMIVSIDQIHNKVKITSIMRDTLVHIPDKGYAKINSAYAKGGPELALKTINTMFNLNIRDYATVNFTGMADIVDAVGGVEVEITEAERQHANEIIDSMAEAVGMDNDKIKKAGLQTLNGVQAVAWSRIRHVSTADGTSNDFGRTDRQRRVMEALFNKALSMGVSKYPALIQALLPYVRTSLGYTDILGLAGTLVGDIEFVQTRVPMVEYIINADYRVVTGSSTVYYNLEYAGKLLHAFIYDDVMPEDYIQQNGVNKTPWIIGG